MGETCLVNKSLSMEIDLILNKQSRRWIQKKKKNGQKKYPMQMLKIKKKKKKKKKNEEEERMRLQYNSVLRHVISHAITKVISGQNQVYQLAREI